MLEGVEQVQEPTVRRIVVTGYVVTAALAVLAQVAEGPAGNGYGWGAVAISSALIGLPLLAVGFMVRSARRRFAWSALVLATLLVAVVLMALAGNWAEQSPASRALDGLVAVMVSLCAVGAVIAEIPLLHRSS